MEWSVLWDNVLNHINMILDYRAPLQPNSPNSLMSSVLGDTVFTLRASGMFAVPGVLASLDHFIGSCHLQRRTYRSTYPTLGV